MYGTYEHDLDIQYHKKEAMGRMVGSDIKRKGYLNLNKFSRVTEDIDVGIPQLKWTFDYFQSNVPVGLHTDYFVNDENYEVVAGIVIPLYWTCKQPYSITFDKFSNEKLMFKNGAMRNSDNTTVINWQTHQYWDSALNLHFPKGVKYRKQMWDLKVADVYKWKEGTAFVFNTKQWHTSSWFLESSTLPNRIGGKWKMAIIGFGSRKKLPFS